MNGMHAALEVLTFVLHVMRCEAVPRKARMFKAHGLTVSLDSRLEGEGVGERVNGSLPL